MYQNSGEGVPWDLSRPGLYVVTLVCCQFCSIDHAVGVLPLMIMLQTALKSA